MAKMLSGQEAIKILKKNFGFVVVSQRSSHIKLKSANAVTIVPNHKELSRGTLKGVLRLAKVAEKDFWLAA